MVTEHRAKVTGVNHVRVEFFNGGVRVSWGARKWVLRYTRDDDHTRESCAAVDDDTARKGNVLF